jgi:hypothetical protein
MDIRATRLRPRVGGRGEIRDYELLQAAPRPVAALAKSTRRVRGISTSAQSSAISLCRVKEHAAHTMDLGC